MAMTPAERQMAYRRRLGIKPKPPLKPCGTLAAYQRHRRKDEPICDLCREAARVSAEKYNRTKRKKKTTQLVQNDDEKAVV